MRAPVRVLDAGGWTDTWFAGRGAVCHLAVGPAVEVAARLDPLRGDARSEVDLEVASFGERYVFPLEAPPGRHPLPEAAVRRACPAGVSARLTITSHVPPGSGLGTSAAVVIAVTAAISATAGRMPPAQELVRTAHLVETEDVGLQSGLQDQVAAAYGGANLVTVGPYPVHRVEKLRLSDATWAELSAVTTTVYLGRPHSSDALHRSVIRRLTGPGGGGPLQSLRSAAERAAAALVAGDLVGYGRAMIDNTRAQAALHPGLVRRLANEVIERSAEHGALGWKVNGAGGEGGTVTILGPADPQALRSDLQAMDGVSVLSLTPDPEGVRVVG